MEIFLTLTSWYTYTTFFSCKLLFESTEVQPLTAMVTKIKTDFMFFRRINVYFNKSMLHMQEYFDIGRHFLGTECQRMPSELRVFSGEDRRVVGRPLQGKKVGASISR
jgi:hypothetical protein